MASTMAGSTASLACWLLTVAGLLGWCAALRDVMLVMPPVARAGSSVTLRCLYDLEGDKLYAVKWYRGNFEFYRATPHEHPDKMAFPYPDFHVDLSESDVHQVTLRRVPLHMSGTFACEVSSDAPSFSTFVKKGQLRVLDVVRRPLLTVSQNVYAPGDELEANCSLPSPYSGGSSAEPLAPSLHEEQQPPLRHAAGHARHYHQQQQHHHQQQQQQSLLAATPPLQAHQLTAEQHRHLQTQPDDVQPASFGFWVNNRPVPASLVQQRGPSGATLRRPLSEADFTAQGELRLKCVVTLADKYREPSHVVTVRRRDDEDDDEDGVEEPPVVVTEAHHQSVGAAAVASPTTATTTRVSPAADRSDTTTDVGGGAARGMASPGRSFVALLLALGAFVRHAELNDLRLRLVP